ncbi:uncharacterized protein LOC105837360 isoform X1 [Monomorium pharaonis]|uniref:uncharacterized protein LOC105837360 isoform X1 n=3 Tax=Monomorium pharaonis TaxID=307658 RepID=UPI00174640DE|nr:uncharacterized protein LOC105837360 isoform X1 [Monomorium pharaonis]XP_036145011.1 uncharacterized protein LOC105837360 isoform X1 [Monomorium pharaonis]XP_036145012.1 uncharacterized protein LOC105837360 isoform X1 [Monomorium pharaonis]
MVTYICEENRNVGRPPAPITLIKSNLDHQWAQALGQARLVSRFQVRPSYRRRRRRLRDSRRETPMCTTEEATQGADLWIREEQRRGISSAVKSARAPRRLENVRNRRAMFYLDGRDDDATAAAHSSSSPNDEIFGWRLNDRKIAVSPELHRVRNHRSPESSFYNDSDDSGSCSFARDVSRQEHESEIRENIELRSFTRDDLDIELIERDARVMSSSSPTTVTGGERDIKEEHCPISPVCYTPERLIRSQEYRILIPSSRRFAYSREVRFTPESESRESYRCQKRLSRLIDSGQIGATQLRTLLNIPSTDARRTYMIPEHRQCIADDSDTSARSNDDPMTDDDCGVQSTKTADSSGSSYYRLNPTIWEEDCKGPSTRPSSLEDTSGIQSYDCSLETQSDAENTPMCLCDELAIASNVRTVHFANDRGVAINEVASILQGLPSDLEKATVLLEEDRFGDSTSSHDQLTRLALTIETDVEAPAVPDDPNNWIRRLRDRIERLQLANKEIHGDIRGLRTNFQCDEKKTINLSSDTMRLFEDVHDLRYFDDLVKLLEGELERISQRNWPFILGHRNPHGEMNLII